MKIKIAIYTKDNLFSLQIPLIALPPSVQQKAQTPPMFLSFIIITSKRWRMDRIRNKLSLISHHSFEVDVA